jgi:hypothetical protein
LAIERRRVSCALAHIQLLALRRGFAASEGTPTKRELEAMITLLPSNADRADLMFLEHRVPLGWALAVLVFGGNVASAVLMLLGQG